MVSELEELLRKIVQCSSYTYEESMLAQLLAKDLRNRGFKVEIQQVATPKGTTLNVIAQVGTVGPLLIFAGHLDVVRTDPAAWNTNPLEFVVKEGIAYGAGIGDMKASIAALILAAQGFRSLPNGRLILAFLADEEKTGLGARAFVNDWLKTPENCAATTRCLIAEPSVRDGVMRVHTGHRALLQYKLTIDTQKGGHGSRPFLSLHPLEVFQHIMPALRVLELELQIKETIQGLPPPTVGFGSVDANASAMLANVIPSRMVMMLDWRVPGPLFERKEQLTTALERAIRNACSNIDLKKIGKEFSTHNCKCDITLANAEGPAQISDTDFFVRICANAVQSVRGSVEVGPSFGSTDGPAFAAVGIPTITNLGPGDLSLSHTPNESVPLERIVQVIEIYKKVIHDFFVFAVDGRDVCSPAQAKKTTLDSTRA